jgi:DNA-binding NarL/FixJ family response regulator
MKKIGVTVFEDNLHLRDSLYFLINSEADMECLSAQPNANNIANAFKPQLPDVVLMDIEMPGISGIDAVRKLKAEFPSVQVLMQTIFQDDDSIFNAICAGASGYLLKSASPQQYIQAIRDVHQGGSPMSGPVARKVLTLFQKTVVPEKKIQYDLTQKEKEVLSNLVEGKSFKMIADALSISYETVRSHMKSIYGKLHVHSNTEAVIKALKEKIV